MAVACLPGGVGLGPLVSHRCPDNIRTTSSANTASRRRKMTNRQHENMGHRDVYGRSRTTPSGLQNRQVLSCRRLFLTLRVGSRQRVLATGGEAGKVSWWYGQH